MLNHQNMKSFAGVGHVLAMVALAGSGCGSIGARCGQASPSTYPGVYPGPRNIIQEMETPRGAAHNILVWPCGIVDFPLSAALDTALLPIDVPYWAFARAPEEHPAPTPDSKPLGRRYLTNSVSTGTSESASLRSVFHIRFFKPSKHRLLHPGFGGGFRIDEL